MKCIQLTRLWQITYILYFFAIYSQDPLNSVHPLPLYLSLLKEENQKIVIEEATMTEENMDKRIVQK